MTLFDDKLPIVACSSGRGENAAIAVIRLSGFECLSQIQKHLSIASSKVKDRLVFQTDILDSNGQVLDEALGLFFKAPKSYTGENVLELFVHGNQININRILTSFTESGIRLAKPGEFTYRALKNKKVSFSQVEGLDMLLNANSAFAFNHGLELLHGSLHKEYRQLLDYFKNLAASIELMIDFSDDVGEETGNNLFKENWNHFLKLISSLQLRASGHISDLFSPEIVLIGQANAGKSSLFNTLLKRNRSIVSNIEGTTRDYITEYVLIDGTNYRLTDTAGLRKTENVIESEGIARTLSVFESAFFKILVVNPFIFDVQTLDFIPSETKFDLVIFTHADVDGFIEQAKKCLRKMPSHDVFIQASLLGELSFGPIGPEDSDGPIGPKKFKSGSIGPVAINGPIGPKDFLSLVHAVVANKFAARTKNNPIMIERHREQINKIYLEATDINEIVLNEPDVAIVSNEINRLHSYISELVGTITPDDVLNTIFSSFCIGK